MKAIVTGCSARPLHGYQNGTEVTILKQDANKTDYWCCDQYGLNQWVCGLDLDFRRIILNPVGLIGSPAAIRAYLAHEAKKVGGGDLTMYYPAIEKEKVLDVVLKMREQ